MEAFNILGKLDNNPLLWESENARYAVFHQVQ